VLFGTADGQVIVMDCHGRMLAHVLLHESDGIVSMSWRCLTGLKTVPLSAHLSEVPCAMLA